MDVFVFCVSWVVKSGVSKYKTFGQKWFRSNKKRKKSNNERAIVTNYSNKFVTPAPNEGLHIRKVEPNEWEMKGKRKKNYVPIVTCQADWY